MSLSGSARHRGRHEPPPPDPEPPRRRRAHRDRRRLRRSEPAASLPSFFPGHVGCSRSRARPPPRQARASPRSRSDSPRSRTPGSRPAPPGARAPPARRRRDQLPAGGDPRAAPGLRRAVPDLVARATASCCRASSAGTSTRTTRSSSPSSSRRTSRRRSCCSGSSGRTGSGSSAGCCARCASARSRADDADARLGWLLVAGTIPVGLIGLLARAAAARARSRRPRRRPSSSSLNGVMLLGAERLRTARRRSTTERRLRRAPRAPRAGARPPSSARRRRSACIPGFSRSGATMSARAARRAQQRGRRPLRVPARHADHRRRGAAQAARPARARRRRRPRPRARGRALRRAHDLRRGPVPAAVLRDQPADAVRDLLHRRRGRPERRVRPGTVILGAVLACSASLLYNVGLALQALDAREAPAEESLRPALLLRLVRRPRWLAGTGLNLLGWPLQAAKRVSSVFATRIAVGEHGPRLGIRCSRHPRCPQHRQDRCG